MKTLLFKLQRVCFLFAIVGCSSQPVLPEKDSVKVGRTDPSKDCRTLGIVKGVTNSVKGTAEDALKDLKQEVANKGGNYALRYPALFRVTPRS